MIRKTKCKYCRGGRDSDFLPCEDCRGEGVIEKYFCDECGAEMDDYVDCICEECVEKQIKKEKRK